MDYEQRYNEALDRAKKLKETCDSTAVIGWCEHIFPELKESEGEKLRKEMLQIAKESEDSFYMVLTPKKKETLITLLEKQGEQKSMKVYRVENEAEQKGLWRKFDGTYEPLFDMLTDGKCKDLPMEDSPIYREGGKKWFASAPSKETLQKWFSKKDLEELVSKGFTISEFEVVGYKKVSDFEYIFTRDNIINRNYLEVSDIYPEQKDFAPKVGPKFKAGDWVVFNGLTLYINEVVKGYYRTISKGGIPNSYDWDIDNAARLWSIEDAKDGDILSYVPDEGFLWIMIYWSLYKPYDGHVHYHALLANGDFSDKGTCCIDIDYLKPATKEQRGQLEEAMANAGYKWNK